MKKETSKIDNIIAELQNNNNFVTAIKKQNSSIVSEVLKMQSSGVFAFAKDIQNAAKSSGRAFIEATSMIEEYKKFVKPISMAMDQLKATYVAMFESTKAFDAVNMNGLIEGIKSSIPAIEAIANLRTKDFSEITESFIKHDFLCNINTGDFSVKDAEMFFYNGEITQEDINKEFVDIVVKKKFSIKDEYNKIQKSKWYFAIKILFCILAFLGRPIIDYAGEKVRDMIGVSQFIEEHHLYDYIDRLFEHFEIDKDEEAQ
ncbi:MAG: hypothetical protein Q4D20_06595 [Clostridia bacterium]|nr:hypothetical protein [Clostridia bacterium]